MEPLHSNFYSVWFVNTLERSHLKREILAVDAAPRAVLIFRSNAAARGASGSFLSLSVCLVAGSIGWIESNPDFGDRADPSIV